MEELFRIVFFFWRRKRHALQANQIHGMVQDKIQSFGRSLFEWCEELDSKGPVSIIRAEHSSPEHCWRRSFKPPGKEMSLLSSMRSTWNFWMTNQLPFIWLTISSWSLVWPRFLDWEIFDADGRWPSPNWRKAWEGSSIACKWRECSSERPLPPGPLTASMKSKGETEKGSGTTGL